MVKQVHLRRSIQERVNQFIHVLRKRGIKVSQVILFGSHAKGKANAESDLDIAIISEQFGEDPTEEMMLLRKLALTVDSHIEPIPLSPQDLKDHYSSLVEEIKRYGIRIA